MKKKTKIKKATVKKVRKAPKKVTKLEDSTMEKGFSMVDDSFFSPKDKKKIIEDAFASEESRLRFGAELIPELKRSVMRDISKIFRIHKLEQGQISSYHKDVSAIATVVNEDGETIDHVVRGNRVFTPEYWTTSFPKICFSDIIIRNYDSIDNLLDKVKEDFSKPTLLRATKLLYYSAKLSKHIYKYYNILHKILPFFFKRSLISNLIKQSIIHKKYIINKKTFSYLYELFYPYSDILRQLNDRFLFNMEIVVIDDPILDDVIFFVPEQEKLGIMPIRIDITMLPADAFHLGKFQYGFLFGRMESMCIPDISVVSCIKLKRNTNIDKVFKEMNKGKFKILVQEKFEAIKKRVKFIVSNKIKFIKQKGKARKIISVKNVLEGVPSEFIKPNSNIIVTPKMKKLFEKVVK